MRSKRSFLTVVGLTAAVICISLTRSGPASAQSQSKQTVVIGAPLPLPVTVKNDASAPVPVTIIKDGAFQTNFGAGYSPSDRDWRAESEPVPEGRRLVAKFLSLRYPISFASATASLEVESCTAFVLTEPGCQGSLAGKFAFQTFVPVSVTKDFDPSLNGRFFEVAAAGPTLLFVEAGQTLCVACTLPENHTMFSGGLVAVSGSLESVE